jgi:hypothetical protein
MRGAPAGRYLAAPPNPATLRGRGA